eukprot:COSAG06_NODE_9292_length_1936_cov_16.360915_1_plen_71_part_00
MPVSFLVPLAYIPLALRLYGTCTVVWNRTHLMLQQQQRQQQQQMMMKQQQQPQLVHHKAPKGQKHKGCNE